MLIFKLAVLLLMGVCLVQGAHRCFANDVRRERYLRVIKGIRPSMFAWATLTIFGVLITGTLLSQLPVLSWGWWSAIGGQGSPVMGQTGEDMGVFSIIIPIVFLAVTAAAMPILAFEEEEMFRFGGEHRTMLQHAKVALGFGLVHATMGIPLGYAIALSLGGVLFARTYHQAHERALDPKVSLNYEPLYTYKNLEAAEKLTAGKMTPKMMSATKAQEIGTFAATSQHLVYNWLIVGYVVVGAALSIL